MNEGWRAGWSLSRRDKINSMCYPGEDRGQSRKGGDSDQEWPSRYEGYDIIHLVQAGRNHQTSGGRWPGHKRPSHNYRKWMWRPGQIEGMEKSESWKTSPSMKAFLRWRAATMDGPTASTIVLTLECPDRFDSPGGDPQWSRQKWTGCSRKCSEAGLSKSNSF